MAIERRKISPVRVCILFYGGLALLNTLVHFPYATDPPTGGNERLGTTAAYYDQAYKGSSAASDKDQKAEDEYVQVAELAAKSYNIDGRVRSFVKEYQLEKGRVLDIGAGRGYLQDLVEDYVGLDISASAARFFHKPFVVGSATSMPFRDNEFDAAWSIWVLEHIPNPESALREIRRVVKPGGVVLLMPAWFCSTWAAEGYDVRPYSDFGILGKARKASLLLRRAPLFQLTYIVPVRALRYGAAKLGRGPTAFHYTRLTPNYKTYWEPDSDAVNSLDPFEVKLWFESRGDRCLDCPSGPRALVSTPPSLVVQVKPSRSR